MSCPAYKQLKFIFYDDCHSGTHSKKKHNSPNAYLSHSWLHFHTQIAKYDAISHGQYCMVVSNFGM